MNNRVGFRTLSNEQVYYVDFSGLSNTALVEEVLFTCVDLNRITEKTLFLINLKDTELTLEVFNYLVDVSKKMQNNVKRSAVIGIEGLTASLFKMYLKLTGSKVQSFNHKNEAISYLVSHEESKLLSHEA